MKAKKNESKTVKTVKMILIWVVLLSATAVVYLRQQQPERPVARISVNGTVVNEVALDSASLPQTFVYDGPGGFSNVIEAEKGRIRVKEAGCPDQICVEQGWIADGTVPIVCLPNQLIIEITGGEGGLDAANG